MFHVQKEERTKDWIFNFSSTLTHHATNNNFFLQHFQFCGRLKELIWTLLRSSQYHCTAHSSHFTW